MNHFAADELLIARLFDLPATERAAFWERVCAENPGLRERSPSITRVLAAGGSPPTPPMPAPLSVDAMVGALESALSPMDQEAPGTRIGPYKLLQKIGEGGFGVVWMAEQLEPLRRRVALKIIKIGMDTEEVIARFEAERQALALMDHPNIARVFDAGATAAGRPFFVMELVRGVAITRYCDENRLTAEARLRLFIPVCQAVQHAHQKGVIHRDLKPSNILVTLHDGVPVPKIIDFGIAKAIDRQLTDKTLVTQFHAFVGTPVYTSPEQMEMSGLDVDTRSDIYSLGVLLYELLAGRPPFDPDALLKSGLETMRRTIREVDPPRPSHQLGTLPEQDRTSVAQQRGTEPGKLSLLLRGDLDWIVMRCLEKDRTRRYATASGLAADIERHLRDDLVVARPPSRVYQVQKFVRRHKLAVAATAAVAASLIAGLVASSALLVRERAAHGRAMMAERQEADLRRQAETVRAEEVKRAARTALDLANRNLADGKVADGLAYLVYAARKDPQNAALAPRLASALASHNFLLPEGVPLECGSRVLAVRFTRDGKSLYVCTEVGTFRVFDASSGELKREFHLGHRVALGGWEFARDNDRLFAAHLANHTLGVFETDSGRSRWTPGALDPNVLPYTEYVGNGHSAGLSPDGRWVYALAQDRFWLWDAATGAVCLQLVPGQQIAGSDITADGRQLAVTVGGVVKRWTLTNAGPVAVPDPPGNPAITNSRTVSFSPDGRQLAVSGFLTGVRLVDVSTGALLRTLPWAEDVLDPASVKFASADRLFASGNRRSGSWNLTTGEFTTLPIAGGLDLVGTSVDATGRRVLAIAPTDSCTSAILKRENS